MVLFRNARQRKLLGYAFLTFLLISAALLRFAPSRADTQRICVTAEGSGSRSGDGWGSSYPAASLDFAVTEAAESGKEVWVAKGLYERKGTLTLPAGVKLYGGFTSGDTSPETRGIVSLMSDPLNSSNATILSRDKNLPSSKEFSIVTCGSGAVSTDTCIDGFTMTGGRAQSGGGLHSSGSLSVSNCAFIGNQATNRYMGGGGIYNLSCSPVITNCFFSDNEAAGKGGAMSSSSSSPVVKSCTFDNCRASKGGGMYYENGDSGLSAVDCTFTGNAASADGGGGIYIMETPLAAVNCTFADNRAEGASGCGGGMYGNGGSIAIVNCTFSGNIAISKGGGLCCLGGDSAAAANSIFWGNKAPTASEIYKSDANHLTVKYCVVSGDYNGEGNVAANPSLGGIRDNGGCVRTIGISAGGSAFRAGMKPGDTVTENVAVPLTDARGVAREIGAGADVGAYSWKYGSGSVKISALESNVEIGQTTTLSINSDVTPLSSDIDAGADALVSLKSSSELIAEVSGNAVTAVSRGEAVISADREMPFPVEGALIKVTGRRTPPAAVTEETRTDAIGDLADASGVIVISHDTTEKFAIYDGFRALSDDRKLPAGIDAALPAAVRARSVDVSADVELFTRTDVKQAIADYWKLGTESEDKVRIVEVRNTIGTDAGEETLWAKFWRLLKSFVTGQFAGDDNSKYLPLQTNFTITSSDTAALPDYIKAGLNKDNLLASVDLFVVVSGDGGTQARSLHDIVSADGEEAKFITVSGDNTNGYKISTRVLLFNMAGSVKEHPGAKWVRKFYAKSTDQTSDRETDNYYIVQDGAADDNYDLCMALACKEKKFAAVNVKVSGDLPAGSGNWTITGDKYKITGKGSWSSDAVSEDRYRISFDECSGYELTTSGDTSKKLPWGGTWDVEAEYSQIHADIVSPDITEITLNWAASADTSWYNADSASFTITTPEEMAGLAALVGSGSDMTGITVTISGDMDLSGADWTPIGTADKPFNGTFSGGGSIITNLSIQDSALNNAGFIGVTGTGAIVRDIKVSGDVKGRSNVGILAGVNNGTITNCVTCGTTKGSSNVGGISGMNNGTVKFSVSEADAVAGTNVGGIAGTNTGTISDAASTGTAAAESAYGTTGGIAGTNTGSVTDSNWITDGGGSGVGAGAPASGDSAGYTTAASCDMPITTVALKITDVTTDVYGGFWITAEAFPENAEDKTLKLTVNECEAVTATAWTIAQEASAEGRLTLTPDTIEADKEPHYIKTSGVRGKYRITAGRGADSKELAEFTLTNIKGQNGEETGCNAGCGALILLALIPLVCLRLMSCRVYSDRGV